MLYWISIVALFFNVNWKLEPNLIDKTHGSNPDLGGVHRVVVSETNASLN